MNKETKNELNHESEPVDGTIFRSKTFKTIEGQKFSNSAVAVRNIKKLSKLEKKWIKKLKVKNLKEGK